MLNTKLMSELRRAVADHAYDVTEDGGLWLPGAKSLITCGGVFEHRLNDGPWHADPNLLPTEGLNAILDIALGAATKQTNWYMAPFATNTAPSSSLTAANFTATQTEFVNYTGTRALWTPAAAAAGVVTNAATPVSITVGAATGSVNTSIYGLGLISASAQSATTGKLAACALFASARTGLVVGDLLGLRYTITLTSS